MENLIILQTTDLLDIYFKKYKENLNYSTAYNYLKEYTDTHGIKRKFFVKNSIRHRILTFLDKNPNKLSLFELIEEFKDIEPKYLSNILLQYLQDNNIKGIGKYSYKKEQHLKHLKYFILEYCIKNESYVIDQKILLYKYNKYLNKRNIKSTNKARLTLYMRELGYKTISRHHSTRYRGLSLKSKNLFDEDINLDQEAIYKRYEIINKLKNSNIEINSTTACKLLSCDLSVHKAKQYINKYNEKYGEELINLEYVIYTIRKIEKLLYKIDISKNTSIKIATAIYLTSKLSQDESSSITGCTSVSLRELLRILAKKPNFDVILKYSSKIKPIDNSIGYEIIN